MALAPLSPICRITPPQPVLILGFRRPSSKFPTVASTPEPESSRISPNLRLSYDLKLQRRKDFPCVYASNTDISKEGSLKETSNETEAEQGPPFLTILAGFLVLFIVGWVVWSVLIWLIGLVVHLFPFK